MDSEYLKYLAKSKNLKLYELGEKMGFEKNYFYKKLKNGSWSAKDMKKVKSTLEVTDSDLKKVFDL